MMLTAFALLSLTRRFQDQLLRVSDRALPLVDRAWDAEGPSAGYDSVLTVVRRAAVAASDGYLALITGQGPQGIRAADVAPSFLSIEIRRAIAQALDQGLAREEASEVGRRQVHAMVRDYTNSSARLAGDHFVRRAGLKVERWRRIPDAKACPWCLMVAGDQYLSAATADFGHKNCGCSAVPVIGAAVDEAVDLAAA